MCQGDPHSEYRVGVNFEKRFCSRRVVSGRARTGREPQADKMRRLAKAFCTPSLRGNKNNSINQEQQRVQVSRLGNLIVIFDVIRYGSERHQR
jgi:hypothetical protein